MLRMQIDHDPNENKKFPDYGEREWAKKKFGAEPQLTDLLYYLIPLAAVTIVLHWIRGY